MEIKLIAKYMAIVVVNRTYRTKSHEMGNVLFESGNVLQVSNDDVISKHCFSSI